MSDVAKPPPASTARFAEFYPFYLSEHPTAPAAAAFRRLVARAAVLRRRCRHAQSVVARSRRSCAATALPGSGHFAFEKNQPASFKQPLYSLMGDWKMFWQTRDG
jgi:hypothetical protein